MDTSETALALVQARLLAALGDRVSLQGQLREMQGELEQARAQHVAEVGASGRVCAEDFLIFDVFCQSFIYNPFHAHLGSLIITHSSWLMKSPCIALHCFKHILKHQSAH